MHPVSRLERHRHRPLEQITGALAHAIMISRLQYAIQVVSLGWKEFPIGGILVRILEY
jgi:hypothetical protein